MKQFTIIIAAFLCLNLNAQDPSFSQFYANKIYLNPALAGTDNGLNIISSYRNQWIAAGGFTTYSVSADLQEPCLKSAFSVSAFYDTEGDAALETFGFSGIYAYTIPFNLNNNSTKRRLGQGNVHLGFKGGYIQQRINWDNLVFSDQIDPIHGIVQPTAAEIGLQQVGFADVSAGIAWRQNWHSKHRRGLRNTKYPIRTVLGLSVSHILRPIQSFNNLSTAYPRKYTIHFGAKIPIAASRSTTHGWKRKFYIIPNFKWDWQGENDEALNLSKSTVFTYGLYIQTPSPLYFGLMIQHQEFGFEFNNTDALITTIGWEMGEKKEVAYVFGLSYDANIGGLSTTSGGVLELSLRIRFQGTQLFCKGNNKRSRRKNRDIILDCENFF